ncbi:glycosyltransferase family 4 protein [Mangrovibacterium sp.]|uniref:glycosyltransferase family 4 protein n=1 Tax=Mangrovibacterium sp. TaxID=1961364 RepID=UPI0035620382
MKKVLIITYYWPPSGGAGVQRWLKFSKYLPEFGVQPVVLTVDAVQASYAQTDSSLVKEVPESIEVHRTDTFELYNLYKKLSGKKEIPYGGFANEGKETGMQKLAKAIRGNFFIPDPRKGWNRYAYRKAVELIRENGIETVITTSPPHSTQLIGLKLKKKLGVRWIADMRDPWTDIYYYKELYHTALARRIDRLLELKVLRNADQIVTVSEDMKRIFNDKLSGSESESKFMVIPNGYDEEDFAQHVDAEKEKYVITYTGTISEAYDIDGFLEALVALPSDLQNRLLLRFVGKVPATITAKVERKCPSLQTELVGYVDHRKSVNYLLKSSMQLLVIPKVENNKGIITGKFFEYLASGNPVLAIGPANGDLDQLIRETGCGKLFEYDDVAAMLQFLTLSMSGEQIAASKEKAQAYSRRELTRLLVEKLIR